MGTLRVALAQVNPTVGDIEGNVSLVLDAAEKAREWHADIVAFPELVVSGYPPEDLLLKPAFLRACEQGTWKIASAVEGITAVVGFPHLDGDLYNAAAICADGEVKGVYHKHHLPTYEVFDEDRYFSRGNHAPIFVVAGTKVGVCICEDMWHSRGPAEWLSHAGAEVVVNINGSPYRRGVEEVRRRMLATRASDHVVALAYVNMLGGQDELVFDGGSMVYDADGNLVASSPSFTDDLLVVDLDTEAVRQRRLHDQRMRKVFEPPPGVETDEIFVTGDQAPQRPPVSAPMASARSVEDQVWQAIVLGIKDYVGKNGFEEVFVAISGGIDSALTATLAVDALGADAVTGVVMSSKYSSEHSRTDAFELATNLGIRVLDVPIEAAHGAFETALRAHIEGLPGQDIAEQNIQSRVRGMYMMALSNARPRAIVLTTGNKSELATGYATLYGDMAGGFSVLKDVPKTLVWELARWRNRAMPERCAGPSGQVLPTSSIEKPPSAELKPGQVDEDSLPPYDVLDPILEAYIEQDRSLDDIAALGFDRELVARVIRMVDRNEYKRRQAPPGPKITSKAFGRDRRLPITNRFTES